MRNGLTTVSIAELQAVLNELEPTDGHDGLEQIAMAHACEMIHRLIDRANDIDRSINRRFDELEERDIRGELDIPLPKRQPGGEVSY